MVDVVVRVDGLFGANLLSGELAAAVCNDLIHVHISRGAGACLENVHGELRRMLAIDDFISRLADEFRVFLRNDIELLIRFGRSELDDGKSLDDVRRYRSATDGEVFDGALCRRSVERFGWDADFAE